MNDQTTWPLSPQLQGLAAAPATPNNVASRREATAVDQSLPRLGVAPGPPNNVATWREATAVVNSPPRRSIQAIDIGQDSERVAS